MVALVAIFVVIYYLEYEHPSVLDRYASEQSQPSFGQVQIPKPPYQDQSWTRPVFITQELATGLSNLINGGFPDPRGCEYREVTTISDYCSGWAELVKTRGWVFPNSGTQQFVICRDGVIRPVFLLGEPTDLKADILNALSNHQVSLPFSNDKLSGNLISATFICLAIRAGEGQLAQPLIQYLSPRQDLIVTAKQEWAFNLLEKSICAHIRGDDSIALYFAQTLDHATHSPTWGPQDQQDLNTITDLIVDEKRRLSEKSLPQSTDYSYIHDMEYICVRQLDEPSAPLLQQSNAVKELLCIAYFNPYPFLRCINSDDNRLTQSVEFTRSFRSDRHILSVKDIAYYVLTSVLEDPRSKYSQFDSMPLDERQRVERFLNDCSKRYQGVIYARWLIALMALVGASMLLQRISTSIAKNLLR
jgi:hypothetical protein